MRLSVLVVLGAALVAGCVKPVPEVTVNRLQAETQRGASGSNWSIRTVIEPGEYEIRALHLNWGSRPSLEHRAFFGKREGSLRFERHPLAGGTETCSHLPCRWETHAILSAKDSVLSAGVIVDWNVEIWYARPGDSQIQKAWTPRKSEKLGEPER